MKPYKAMRRGVKITVWLDPFSQAAGPASASGWTFAPTTVNVTGGTPTAYAWSIANAYGGNWGISSGQGTPTAQAAVGQVADGEMASCTLTCTVTVGGVNYSASASHSYERSGSPQ